jgi:hypothetical protein
MPRVYRPVIAQTRSSAAASLSTQRSDRCRDGRCGGGSPVRKLLNGIGRVSPDRSDCWPSMGRSIRNFVAVTRIGLDLARKVFQVHAVDAKGEVVAVRKLTRSPPVAFFSELPPCVVAMEACSASLGAAIADARLRSEAFEKRASRNELVASVGCALERSHGIGKQAAWREAAAARAPALTTRDRQVMESGR